MSEKTLKGAKKREKDILNLIRSNPIITSAELAKTLEVIERTIERDTTRLCEEHKIKRQGGDKGGEWVIL